MTRVQKLTERRRETNPRLMTVRERRRWLREQNATLAALDARNRCATCRRNLGDVPQPLEVWGGDRKRYCSEACLPARPEDAPR